MTRRFTIAIFLALIAAAPFFNVLPGWTPAVASLAAFTALLLIGLNIVFGLAGMLALGQAAFALIPGYIAGISLAAGVPAPIALVSAILATVGLARLVAIVFVRLPGIYLAFGTLGFAIVTEGLARAFPEWTGGASGLVFASDFQLTPKQWYAVALAVLLAGLATYAILIRGAFARRLSIVRCDELAAEVVGINVARVKANAFTLASCYAAVAGLFIAYYTGVLVPEMGGVNHSLDLLAMLMIGGAGTLSGPLLGSALVHWLSSVAGRFGAANEMEVLFYGIGFFATAMFAPKGLAGLIPRAWQLGYQRQPVRTQNIAPNQLPAGPGDPLHIKDVSKSFAGIRAVDNVNLEVAPGEVIVLIGPNGAGKTTLFNLVSGLEQADQGSLFLGTTDITTQPVYVRARSIGRSFQVARLVPELTVLENLAARLDQLEPGMTESERFGLASRELERFGLLAFSDASVDSLSAGQQKLIDVVRASLGQPRLMLFDEPAVGLSDEELSHLASMINEVRRSAAILIVEHNFHFVAQVADRAVVLERGCVIADGPLEEVTRNEVVRSAYYGALV